MKKLKKNITDEKLFNYFRQFGELKNAYVICDPENGRSKGFGYVQFIHQADVEKAFKTKHKIEDKEVFINRFEIQDLEKKKKLEDIKNNEAINKDNMKGAENNNFMKIMNNVQKIFEEKRNPNLDQNDGSYKTSELDKAFEEGFYKATKMFNQISSNYQFVPIRGENNQGDNCNPLNYKSEGFNFIREPENNMDYKNQTFSNFNKQDDGSDYNPMQNMYPNRSQHQYSNLHIFAQNNPKCNNNRNFNQQQQMNQQNNFGFNNTSFHQQYQNQSNSYNEFNQQGSYSNYYQYNNYNEFYNPQNQYYNNQMHQQQQQHQNNYNNPASFNNNFGFNLNFIDQQQYPDYENPYKQIAMNNKSISIEDSNNNSLNNQNAISPIANKKSLSLNSDNFRPFDN